MASQHLRLLITPPPLPPPPCLLAVQRATKRGPLMEVISLPYRTTELYSVCVVQHLTVNWPSQPQPTSTTVLYNYVHAALVVCASHTYPALTYSDQSSFCHAGFILNHHPHSLLPLLLMTSLSSLLPPLLRFFPVIYNPIPICSTHQRVIISHDGISGISSCRFQGLALAQNPAHLAKQRNDNKHHVAHLASL